MYRNKSFLFALLCLFSVCGYGQKKLYVSTFAGDTANMYRGLDSNAGYYDGPLSSARFNAPTGIAVDTLGNVYVADAFNNLIRKINVSTGMVTTLAGDTADIKKGLDSNLGYINGAAIGAKFSNPLGVCVDDSGNVYVADTYNNVIRKIWASTGKVTTYAGKDSSGTTFAGYANGPDSVAEFFVPVSLTIDSQGNLYVADNGNNAIREISKSGMVSTVAGRGPDTLGYINGPIDTAEFYSLFGIAVQNSGAVFASQFANGYNAVRRCYHDTVTTYSGYDTIGFDSSALSNGQLIPSGYMNGYQGIYQNSIDTNSSGDTLYNIVKGVLYNGPTGIAFDTSGNLLVADEFNNVIRTMNAKDSLVSTFAGNDTLGFRDDWDSLAEFYNPVGVVSDKKGSIYVADLGNNLIRKISLKSITGIQSIEKPASILKAYPNPCNDRLTIISSVNGIATLLDVTGRIVWTDNDFKSPYTLSTSSISPGIYFLKVTSFSLTEIKKIEVLK